MIRAIVLEHSLYLLHGLRRGGRRTPERWWILVSSRSRISSPLRPAVNTAVCARVNTAVYAVQGQCSVAVSPSLVYCSGREGSQREGRAAQGGRPLSSAPAPRLCCPSPPAPLLLCSPSPLPMPLPCACPHPLPMPLPSPLPLPLSRVLTVAVVRRGLRRLPAARRPPARRGPFKKGEGGETLARSSMHPRPTFPCGECALGSAFCTVFFCEKDP